MPAASCPGQSTTRRLMSRCRLCTRKPCGRTPRLPRAAAPNLAIRRRPRECRQPLAGPRPRPTNSDKPTSEAFGAGPGHGREGRTHRARLKRFTGPGWATRTHPYRETAARRPRRPFEHRSKAHENPGAAGPLELPREPNGPDRSAAPAQGESGVPRRRNRRRAGLPNPSSRWRDDDLGRSDRGRNDRDRSDRGQSPPPPPNRNSREGSAVPRFAGCRVDLSPKAQAHGPKPGEPFTLADDPALSRGK